MKLFFYALFLIIFSSLTFSQVNESDSLRRVRYLKEVERLKEMERLINKDPNRYRDSVANVRRIASEENAAKRITEYKSDLLKLARLKEVDLSHGKFSEIPEFVWKADSLEVLILDDNHIAYLPKRLNDLKNLKRIYWRRNDLANSRPKIKKLKSIEKLDLTENGLKKLPKTHRMMELKELVLNDNEFIEIPTRKLKRNRNLIEFELSSNPIQIEKGRYKRLDHIQKLKLNKCDITSIHPSLYQMSGLDDLQLGVNKLDGIPSGISKLNKLTKLLFYKNQLKELPSDLFDISTLEIVDLYYNQLELIPSEIEQLVNLSILYISHNQLYNIPEEIGNLDNLTELYIHNNRISEFPSSLSNLKKLKTFHINDNYLVSFPRFIINMPSITFLNISNNDISSLPMDIERMNLDEFFYKDLSIDYQDPDNLKTVEMIQRMRANGVKVNPVLDFATKLD